MTGLAVIIVVVVGIAFLALIRKQICSRTYTEGNKNPPGPPGWPIIGHLHHLLLLKKKNQPIHRLLSLLSERHGPVMHLRLGCRPVLVISSADDAKECLTTNDRLFASRPRLATGKHMGYNYASLVWASYSPYWRNVRKFCTLELLSAKRIQLLKHVRTEEISTFIRSLFNQSSSQKGRVNMKSRLFELTFNIILRMVANKRYFGPGSDKSEEAERFKELINETFFLAGVFNVGDYLPFLKWLDLQGHERAMKNLHKRRDAFMQALVDEHRQRRSIQGGKLVDDADFIDVLLSASENDDETFVSIFNKDDNIIKSTGLTMITAGTDTSSVTIEWALAALLEHPHILMKAQEELDTQIGQDRVVEESDLPNLNYLQAIVKETFRLYPAAPLLVPHASTEPCTVGGYNVPAGTRLLVNAWAIHRDPAVWERPTEFDPERFFKANREKDVRGQDFDLIPFGSGRRVCPGMSLGLCVVQHTLAWLLHSFEWFVPLGLSIDMTEGLGLTMPKAIPLEAHIKPRLPPHLY
eukprot:Gb_28694 [translate_table: standard]